MEYDAPLVPTSVQTGLAIVSAEGHIWCDVLFQNQSDACQYFIQHWKGDREEMKGFRLASASQIIEVLHTGCQPTYLSPPLSEFAESA